MVMTKDSLGWIEEECVNCEEVHSTMFKDRAEPMRKSASLTSAEG